MKSLSGKQGLAAGPKVVAFRLGVVAKAVREGKRLEEAAERGGRCTVCGGNRGRNDNKLGKRGVAAVVVGAHGAGQNARLCAGCAAELETMTGAVREMLGWTPAAGAGPGLIKHGRR